MFYECDQSFHCEPSSETNVLLFELSPSTMSHTKYNTKDKNTVEFLSYDNVFTKFPNERVRVHAYSHVCA